MDWHWVCRYLCLIIPIISFDIEKEGFGLYYKADNLEDLKEKMNYMISNSKVLENMGNKARAFAL